MNPDYYAGMPISTVVIHKDAIPLYLGTDEPILYAGEPQLFAEWQGESPYIYITDELLETMGIHAEIGCIFYLAQYEMELVEYLLLYDYWVAKRIDHE